MRDDQRMFYLTLSKRALVRLIVINFLLLAGAAVIKCGMSRKAAMAPVYHGSEAEKKISLTINVVWGKSISPKY